MFASLARYKTHESIVNILENLDKQYLWNIKKMVGCSVSI